MTDTLFTMPKHAAPEPAVTKYVPSDWVDEVSPPPQAEPNKFLHRAKGEWYLVEHGFTVEDSGCFKGPVRHGDLIEFDSFRDYGSGRLTVHEDRSWTVDFDYPEDANTFFIDNEPETVMGGIDEIIRTQAENDPEEFTPPYETDLQVSFWGDRTTFRVVIDGESARLDKLPEPPFVAPYTNWRGETAIRRIRPPRHQVHRHVMAQGAAMDPRGL